MRYVKVSNVTYKFDPNGKGFDCWLNSKLLKATEFLIFKFEDLPPNWEDMQKLLNFEFIETAELEKTTGVGTAELKELLKDAIKELDFKPQPDMRELIRDVAKEIAQNLSFSTGAPLGQTESSVTKAVQTFIPEIENLETTGIQVESEKSKGLSIANIRERLARSKKTE